MNTRFSTPYSNIHETYKQTPNGQILENRSRWSRFLPSNFDVSRWKWLLGADVNNLSHLKSTLGNAKALLNSGSFTDLTDEDKEILFLTSITHDWAEAKVGDISFIHKTEEDEAEEIKVLTGILAQYIDDESAKKHLPSVIETVRDNKSKLGQVFRLIECFGYFHTARLCFQIMFTSMPHLASRRDAVYNDPEAIFKVHALAYEVMSYHLRELINESEKYDCLREFLVKMQPELDLFFETDHNDCYDFPFMEGIHEVHAEARQMWEQFKNEQ